MQTAFPSIQPTTAQATCNFHGLVPDTVPYEAVYRIARALISSNTLSDNLKEISENAHNSQYVLALMAPPKGRHDVTHLVYWPELTPDMRHKLKGLIDMEAVQRNTIFVDTIRLTAGKPLEEIARFFGTWCAHFNDALLADKWKTFADEFALS